MLLIVEDDDDVAELIEHGLRGEGHSTLRAATLDQAVELLDRHHPRLVLVDLGLPDGSGLSLVRRLASQRRCGTMVISGRTTEVDRVVALELGADDYITKPFSLREVVARVGSVLRRLESAEVASVAPAHRLDHDGIRLEPDRMMIVGRDGTEVRLTGAQSALLGLLLAHRGEAVSREEIGRRVLGAVPLPRQRGVDQLVSELRAKLHAAGSRSLRIVAIRSAGYRIIL